MARGRERGIEQRLWMRRRFGVEVEGRSVGSAFG